MDWSKRLLAPHQLKLPEVKSSPFEISLSRLKRFLANRRFAVEQVQFADVACSFGILLANGLPVIVAIRWLQPRLSGEWREQFGLLVQNLDLGADLVSELGELSRRVPIAEVGEFCQKLQFSIERGTPSAHQIMQLSESINQQVIRALISRAGKNETKMLVPTIFLILPVTVLFAVFPSLLVLQSSYR